MPVAGALLFALSGMVCLARGDVMADPEVALKLVFSLAIFPILLAIIVDHDWRRLDYILLAWLAGAATTAAVAVASRYGIPVFGFIDAAAASGRAYGLSYHPNQLAYTGALTAPVAIYFLVRVPDWRGRALALVALFLVLAGLHLSGSRAALLSFLLAVGVVSLGLLRLRYAAAYLMITVGSVAVAVLLATLVVELGLPIARGIEESAIGRILGLSEGAGQSNAGRLELMRHGWEQFLTSPFFGHGYGHIRWSHFHILSILHSGGLLGLLAFLVWLVGIGTMCWRVATGLHRIEPAIFRTLWPVCVAGLVIWFVDNAFQPLMTDRSGYVLVGVLFVLEARLRSAPISSSPIQAPTR